MISFRPRLYQLGAIAILVGLSGLPFNHHLNGVMVVDQSFTAAGVLAIMASAIWQARKWRTKAWNALRWMVTGEFYFRSRT